MGRITKRVKHLSENIQNTGESVLKIAKNANLIGIIPKIVFKIRGNGILIVSNKRIYFEMWIPKKLITIPLSSIKEIKIVNKFLGHFKKQHILKIVFFNDSLQTNKMEFKTDPGHNNEIEMGLWVKNPIEWKELLDSFV